jgi:Pvc16 N-terminal domain
VIHEVDDVLKGLLSGGALAGTGVEVSFDAPTRDWAARRNSPTIDAYLYDIREDVRRRERGAIPVHDDKGFVVSRRQPPRWFRLSYLVTAWTKRPEDEHRLLSAVLATLLPREVLPPSELTGALAALGLTIPLTVAGMQSDARSFAEIWSALGGELKPSLDVVITAPFPASPEYEAGPPVTEGAGVRVRGTDGTLDGSAERHHRPRHLAKRPGSVPAPRTPGAPRTSGSPATPRTSGTSE